jgi:hypothetical protein
MSQMDCAIIYAMDKSKIKYRLLYLNGLSYNFIRVLYLNLEKKIMGEICGLFNNCTMNIILPVKIVIGPPKQRL